MLPAERHKLILELIETQNSISVAELRELLNVSDMTIRRDLRTLSNEGLLERVYGGAVSRRGRSYEPAYRIRAVEQVTQKEIIGRCAATLIHEGDSVALDVGTTTLELAKALAGTSNLTVITASLPIASVLSEAPNVRLILTGGIVRKQEHSLIGHIAQRSFEEFHVDKAFVGIGGIHPTAGLTEYNLEDAIVKRAMIANAGKVIVVTDSRKLGKICFAWIAPLSNIDILVTDAEASPKMVDLFTSNGTDVIIAQ